MKRTKTCTDFEFQQNLCFVMNGLVGRVFANGPGDLGSIPGRVVPKTFKMVLDTSLLNTQQYKVLSRVKWLLSCRYWKEGLLVALYYGIPKRGLRLHKKCFLDMTLDYVGWWGSSSEAKRRWSTPSVPLLPGPLWFGELVPVRVPYICLKIICNKNTSSYITLLKLIV